MITLNLVQNVVIPAKAGIHILQCRSPLWIPAFAGMMSSMLYGNNLTKYAQLF
jgi:hypothetical protein